MTSLWFTNNDTVLVTFVTRSAQEGVEAAPRRDSDESLPLQLQAVFVDADTGKIVSSPAWPTLSRRSQTIAAYDGSFVVQRGDQLTRYSSALSILNEAKLPQRKDVDWGAHPSPTGKSILFVAPNIEPGAGRDSLSYVWVDAESLSVVRSWTELPGRTVAIADDRIAMSTFCAAKDCEPTSIKVRELSSTNWSTIAAIGGQDFKFIRDDILFVSGGTPSSKSMTVMRTDGRILFSQQQSHERSGEGWDSAVVSAGGLRFVIPGYQTKGNAASLDISGHSTLNKLLVFDVSTSGAPRILDIGGPRINYAYTMPVALSPDGSKLAILDGEILELLRLPPISAGGA